MRIFSGMENTPLDRLLWTLLLGATVAAATVLSRRGLGWLWRRTRGIEPPEAIGMLEALAHRTTAPFWERRR